MEMGNYQNLLKLIRLKMKIISQRSKIISNHFLNGENDILKDGNNNKNIKIIISELNLGKCIEEILKIYIFLKMKK